MDNESGRDLFEQHQRHQAWLAEQRRAEAAAAVPQIPVSPPTRTAAHRVELSDDQQRVRVTTLADPFTPLSVPLVHDIDPAEARLLAARLLSHAETAEDARADARRDVARLAEKANEVQS